MTTDTYTQELYAEPVAAGTPPEEMSKQQNKLPARNSVSEFLAGSFTCTLVAFAVVAFGDRIHIRQPLIELQNLLLDFVIGLCGGYLYRRRCAHEFEPFAEISLTADAVRTSFQLLLFLIPALLLFRSAFPIREAVTVCILLPIALPVQRCVLIKIRTLARH